MKYHKKTPVNKSFTGVFLTARSGIEGGPLLENPVK